MHFPVSVSKSELMSTSRVSAVEKAVSNEDVCEKREMMEDASSEKSAQVSVAREQW